jgi:hypothetical protein
MKTSDLSRFAIAVWSLFATTYCVWAAAVDGPAQVDLIGDTGLAAWRKPTGLWLIAGDAGLEADHPNRLTPLPGRGVIVNGPTGKTSNLVTIEDYGDVDVHIEFMIPKNSNSGVKFQERYEIQISDSFGVAKPKATQCGGIYPRAEMLPKYHHIDDGIPPRANAAKPAGQWQTLDVVFRAPQFGADGKKIRNARFERVVLNGQTIHEAVEVPTPTGHIWRNKEVARGPILLQGDHGPVAFRNLRVRAL